MRFSAVLSLLAVSANSLRHCRKHLPLAGLLACGWLATLPPATAAEPTVDAQSLGITESILAYCGPIDPEAAAKIRERIRDLARGASEQQLAAVRNSEEYRRAYDSMVEFAGKIDEHNAKRVCSETPAKSK